MMTVPQTAQALGMRKERVYDLLRAGVLPKVLFGRQIRIEESALRAWIAAGGKGLQ